VIIKDGDEALDSTPAFDTVLANIRADEGEVWVRELGFGLNRAFTQERTVSDIGTYERMCGIHLSLGAKHGSYNKPNFKRKDTRIMWTCLRSPNPSCLMTRWCMAMAPGGLMQNLPQQREKISACITLTNIISDSKFCNIQESALSKEKMGSRELGLVLTQQILGVDDLHYGLWNDDLELKMTNLGIAQQRYTDNLIAAMPAPQPGRLKYWISVAARVMYSANSSHAVIRLMVLFLHPAWPSWYACNKPNIRKTKPFVRMRFEDLPFDELLHQYDVCLFSESFHISRWKPRSSCCRKS